MSKEAILCDLQRFDCQRVVLSGGEPLLQMDEDLVCFLKSHGYTLAIETNGSIQTTLPFDWITLSPKVPQQDLRLSRFDELKFVLPHYHPSLYMRLVQDIDPLRIFLQPESQTRESTLLCIEEAKKHGYRLSIQAHKYIGVE